MVFVDNYSKKSLIEDTACEPGRKGGDENTWVGVKPVFCKKAGFVVCGELLRNGSN
jgi:hypothetical protein